MSTLNAAFKLTAYDATGASLGDLQVTSDVTWPVGNPLSLLPTSIALRDILRSLWFTHYADTSAVATWTMTLQASLDGRAFEDVRMEDLPMDFDVLILPTIQGLLEKALAALA